MKFKSNTMDGPGVPDETDTSGYETILNSLTAGVCRLDRDGRILYGNDSAAVILGRQNEELIDQNYWEVFFGEGVSPNDPRCAPIQFTLVESEVSHVNTERFFRTDRSDVLLEFMCVPVIESGEPAGAVISFEDVTDRREVEDAVSKAREVALAGARSKAEFLANMSHEIRTPLTGIIGTVDLLDTAALDNEQREYVRMLRSSTEFLHGIVNDILDFSKIEAGKFQSGKGVFSIETLVKDCIDSYRSTVAEKGIELSYEIARSVPSFVFGDMRIIRQVLNNLLNNAIKFTDAGSVEVLISSANEDGKYRFLVKDTGIGIDSVDSDELFEAFTQADSTDSRDRSGTGLGLAISRRLVELMNGRIGLTSKFGAGTEIWFEIPLEEASETPVETHRSRPLSPKAPDLSVLVVEDNPINLRVMQKMLERLGIGSEKASSGQEAVAVCAERKFDIIFMDCQMPGMDGIEAAQKIKSQGGNPPTVIAFTASAADLEADRPEGPIMDGILRKPFTKNDLIDVLNAFSGESESGKILDLVKDIGEHSISQFVESETLERLSGLETDDSRGFVTEILEVFAEHTSERLVQLCDYVASDDREHVKRVAHNLKGSSASVGIRGLSGLFGVLEKESYGVSKEKLNELLHKIEIEFAAVNSAIAELKNEEDPNEG